MNIIKLSDNMGELEAVRDKAAEELQYLRSLDTAGDGNYLSIRMFYFFKQSYLFNRTLIYLKVILCYQLFLS